MKNLKFFLFLLLLLVFNARSCSDSKLEELNNLFDQIKAFKKEVAISFDLKNGLNINSNSKDAQKSLMFFQRLNDLYKKCIDTINYLDSINHIFFSKSLSEYESILNDMNEIHVILGFQLMPENEEQRQEYNKIKDSTLDTKIKLQSLIGNKIN